ncbi:hypothetical protein [Streptomyces piniterrae]|nr:hypothetical protein [Streptomyces piniterrae]
MPVPMPEAAGHRRHCPLNVDGCAIAVERAIGVTDARITSTLINSLRQDG